MNEQTRQDELFPWEETEGAAASAAGREAVSDETDPLLRQADILVGRERMVAQKEYYAISEVCDLVGLKPHVLRYWETQFQVLNPSKNRSGNRVYQRKEIKLILLVKHLLYEEKYTVEGARAKLDVMRRGGTLRDLTTAALDAEMIALLRQDLHQLARIVALPAAQ
jgi:DNA-binding transcriptional MerR regulator